MPLCNEVDRVVEPWHRTPPYRGTDMDDSEMKMLRHKRSASEPALAVDVFKVVEKPPLKWFSKSTAREARRSSPPPAPPPPPPPVDRQLVINEACRNRLSLWMFFRWMCLGKGRVGGLGKGRRSSPPLVVPVLKHKRSASVPDLVMELGMSLGDR
ncbi:hypothetical protein BC829DRAFT_80277 [Chytridium lagenaria]|nr:hypothetical protein BC829DRAFT_80277 [Chytridium lagenaria]